MSQNYKSELVAVFGHPVSENPTCVMQEAAFAERNLPWRYLTIEVEPSSLADAVRGARAFGMQGLNLTIPHKIAVLPLLDDISPDAALIGAVNTVRRDGKRFIGENTDGKGFLRGLREDLGESPAGKRVTILGAGGAARAIAFELALAGAAQLVIWNRSHERGEALCNDLRQRVHADVRLESWSRTCGVGPETDILVNATSIGLFPGGETMPDVDLRRTGSNAVVCDVIPNPPETRFVQTARAMGLRTLTGLSMLVYQGAIGFEMWTGQKAPLPAMKSALEKVFQRNKE